MDYLLVLSTVCLVVLAQEVPHDVNCKDDLMKISVRTKGDVYLENLKGYPECQAESQENDTLKVFTLPLADYRKCGISKMTNQLTGAETFYQRVIVELAKEEKQTILVKCKSTLQRSKRQSLDGEKDFELLEPEHLNISEYIEAHAPIPYVDLGIRQNGRMLDTTLNVVTGTPLEMVIFLDDKSKSTYGILMKFLKVSDAANKQQEIIIQNACSVDPYNIFGQFDTPDNGDTLVAKFRAFKFPESDYVMFSGTVNVCIKECKPIPCGNGQFGHGRRRREASLLKDPNRIYEVELTTLLKVEFNNDLFALKKGELSGELDVPVNALPLAEDNLDGGSDSTNGATLAPCSFVLLIICVIFNQLISYK